MIFRLSQKLNTKIKAGKTEVLPQHSDPMLDWSCHVFKIGRIQHILLTNTYSLYSCIIPGKGSTTTSSFQTNALDGICHHLLDNGYTDLAIKFKQMNRENIQFSKALNRSITGSMNDFITSFQLISEVENRSLTDHSKFANRTPMSALGKYDNDTHGYPYSVFQDSLSQSKFSRD